MNSEKLALLLRKVIEFHAGLDASNEAVNELTTEYMYRLRGGTAFTNTTCSNISCTSTNNGCTNSACTETGNQSCHNSGCG